MSTNPPYGSSPGGPDSFGRRIEEAIELIELEVHHAAAYINAAVIPQVRTESISALRTVADSLRKFADRLDRSGQAQSGPTSQPPQPPKPPNP